MTDIADKTYPILAYFKYDHLPPNLQLVSRPFADLAYSMTAQLGVSAVAEVAAGLRKLLEAKDCFVRAALTVRAPAVGKP